MKKHFFIFTFLVLSIIAISIFTNSFTVPTVMAGSADNLSGFAWSSNIGWVSFNSTNCDSDEDGITDDANYVQCPIGDASSDYGVNISPTEPTSTGIFSGYAWSENIGWVSFNRADTGNPPQAPFDGGSGPIAQVDWVTGNVTGWARALASGGGWDGWIKLAGIADDSSPYGVTYNNLTSGFEGYAWGSEVVGWIDFNPALGGVSFDGTLNTLPVAVDDSAFANENTAQNINVIANDTDADGDALIIEAGSVTNPSNGTATRLDNVTVQYTPDAGFSGVDTFDYTVSDGNGGTDIGTVTVTVYNCGNGVVEGSEQCDDSDLDGQTCITQGFTSGTLSCTASCTFDTSACNSEPLCGNGICESGENFLNCSIDCTDPIFEEF